MRKIRVDRIKRHMARSTPDRIKQKFTQDQLMNQEHLPWAAEFERKMHIKHGHKFDSIVLMVHERWSLDDRVIEAHVERKK